MKRNHSFASILPFAAPEPAPTIVPFPDSSTVPQRDRPRGRAAVKPGGDACDAALTQVRNRLLRMIVDNERDRTHGNRAS